MESKGSPDINRPKVHNHLTLRDVAPGASHMYRLLDVLERKINLCPKVDAKGNSECPFAEDLYAQKDEAAEKVREHLRVVRMLLEPLENELAILHDNLAKLESDSRSLHLAKAREEYFSARKGLESHIQKNSDRKKEIQALISRAAETLRLAREKKWPLGEPKRPALFSRVTPSSTSNSGFSLKREVDGLLSLGPIGREAPSVGNK